MLTPERQAAIETAVYHASGLPEVSVRQETRNWSVEDFDHALRHVNQRYSGEQRELMHDLFKQLQDSREAVSIAKASWTESKRGADASVASYRLNKWILGFTILAVVLTAASVILALR